MIQTASPNRIGIVTTDNHIKIGYTGITGIRTDKSWVPSDVIEVWWDGESGTIEYNDGKPMVGITSLPSIYNQAKIDWQYVWDKFPENATSEKRCYKLLRSLRDQKLRMSDWTQFNDSPFTDAKKDEWKTYRQALRDITSSQPTPNIKLSNITWPTEPS